MLSVNSGERARCRPAELTISSELHRSDRIPHDKLAMAGFRRVPEEQPVHDMV